MTFRKSWRNTNQFTQQPAPPEIILAGPRGVIRAPAALRKNILHLLKTIARDQPVIHGRTGGQFDFDLDLDFNNLIAEFLGDDVDRQWEILADTSWPDVYELGEWKTSRRTPRHVRSVRPTSISSMLRVAKPSPLSDLRVPSGSDNVTSKGHSTPIARASGEQNSLRDREPFVMIVSTYTLDKGGIGWVCAALSQL